MFTSKILFNSRLASLNLKNKNVVGVTSTLFPVGGVNAQSQPLFLQQQYNELHKLDSRGRRLFSSKPFTMVETKLEDVQQPERPISPHLTIYKLPMPAILSVTHRATGIALGVGLATLAGLSVFGAHDVPYYIELFKQSYPSLVYPARFCVAFPITFHAFAGIRHIYWDTFLKGINTKPAEFTGMIILAASLGVSLIVTFCQLTSA
ncbi:succinate dehydrogenase [Heterostelium album PN500]|uniref:Succinate dehydrogenase n=1 Tax=Heterostelium pallidum (strain ATCC 26659 / Pp 5 / PN500) TaxID=670386 RepID=D3BBK5_HETP5|nr:succinate dehydrogenase [Heterostelium album PN500]EFA81038.1 succinate dehydrogenase [Heterostelium album PN500]|eukprot:XP_020433156.1 succinate dehydrogenase [Heterostelium album PN500]